MEKIIKIGAEATISSTKWFEISAISKIRHKKKYRPIEIDNLIRVQRTIKEANIMNKTRLLKIDVPIIYFVDPNNAEIIMENVDGPRIKEYLSNKNIDCKGHTGSAHLTGEGADLRVDRDRARIVIQKAIEMGFSVGIQQRGNSRFIHVDTKIRKSGKANLWSYA